MSILPGTSFQLHRYSAFFVIAVALIVYGEGLPAAQGANKAHQHGIGQMNIAVEAQNIEIELEIPGADLVGFEHKATTPAQQKTIKEAAAKLKDGNRLFTFPATAECRMIEADVESPLLEKEEAHKHEHAHEDKNEEEHAEFHAHYHFQCVKPDQLTHLDVQYFKTFPSAHELTVQIISATGQSVQRLTPKAARLKF
jgi:hypothetical protein